MVTCDRCGNKLWNKDGDSGKLKLAWKKRSIKATLLTLFSGNYDGRHYFECQYNLCESCRQQLERWMLGGDGQ